MINVVFRNALKKSGTSAEGPGASRVSPEFSIFPQIWGI